MEDPGYKGAEAPEAGEPERGKGARKRDEFEFDAPKMKDFTKEAYQKQRKAIEEILLETDGGQRDPPQKKRPLRQAAVSPRSTFFSALYQKTLSSARPPDPRGRGAGAEAGGDDSVDDGWFREREAEMSERDDPGLQDSQTADADVEKNPGLFMEPDLFPSTGSDYLDDESPEATPRSDAMILDKLRFIDTPPIKQGGKRAVAGRGGAAVDLTPIKKRGEESDIADSPHIYKVDKGLGEELIRHGSDVKTSRLAPDFGGTK